MIYICALIWLLLLIYAWCGKDIVIKTLVTTQFLFIGAGLIVFPLAGENYYVEAFQYFDFSTIDIDDFNYANFLVIAGTIISICFYNFFLTSGINIYSKTQNVKYGDANRNVFLGFVVLCGLITIPFILSNIANWLNLLLAEAMSDLASASEHRETAGASYLSFMIVFNVLPAIAIISVVQYVINRTRKNLLFCFCLVLITFVALVVTFQKRPLIVVLVALWFILNFGAENSSNQHSRTNYSLVLKLMYILPIVAVLFGLYYVATSFRIDGGPDDTSPFIAIMEIIGTRVLGRLSTAAVFYVDFFPTADSYYGFGNLGIVQKLFGGEIYPDTKVVFSHYSTVDVNGTVAASVFMDAYGQGGEAMIVVQAFFIALILSTIKQMIEKVHNHGANLALSVFLMIFIYYLSQASLFRSMLGYGGVPFLLTWVCIFAKSKNN